MKYKTTYRVITVLAALVWLVNGMYCKILNYVPRHQEIVEKILSLEDGRIFTMMIGFSEVLMAIWIISKLFPRLNVLVQISIVLVMNIIEQIMAGELLLWGGFNFVFALGFCLMLAFNEYLIKARIKNTQHLNSAHV